MWHKIELTNRQVADGEQVSIDNFVGELVKHLNDNDSRGIAIFSKMTSTGFTHYFSPKASTFAKEIIDSYGAVVCDPPTIDDKLHFMAGDKNVALTLKHT